MSNTSSSGGGVGICGLLFVAFLCLKLTGHLEISWWWIFAPLWIPMLFVAFLIAFIVFAEAKR